MHGPEKRDEVSSQPVLILSMKNKKDPFPVARGGVFLFRENSVQKERIRIIRCFVDRLYGSNPRIITILSCDITRMSGKVGYLLTILDQISTSNDFQLARQIANTPIHQDQFGIVNQEISKKRENGDIVSLKALDYSAYVFF